MSRGITLPAVLLALLLIGGCGGKGDKTGEIVIAEQFGLAYAPLQVLKARGSLRDAPGNAGVTWVRTSNAAAIREAMAAGRMDIGFMGIPPFLIGADQGMGWKTISGLSRSPLGLVTTNPDITSLAGFGPADRIALPQPGSIQHILLAMAAQRELGSPSALDGLLVTLGHPDGMSALLSGTEITAHFTSPPYLMMELAAPGTSLVVSGNQAFGGPFTFIVAVAADPSSDKLEEFLPFFTEQLARSCRFLQEQPAEAAVLLADTYNMTAEELLPLLTAEDTWYGTEILGLDRFAEFMYRAGYLESPLDPRTLAAPP